MDRKKVWPPKKARERIRREQKFLNKIYASSSSRRYFEDSFQKPLNSFITSYYGAQRVFNNKKQTQHLGVDFRAPIGEAIYSANSGRVVVARSLYYTGKTVTLDHGLGIFTIYGHLSKLYVSEGDYVPKYEVIGEAGMTGRTTGPHLHWGIKVNGHFVDGLSLVKETGE